MNRNVALASTFAASAALAFALIAGGCSSTSNSGTGGATGSGGDLVGLGGTNGGAGGKTGGTGGTTGGSGGSTGGADAGVAACGSPAPDDGTTCSNNPPCAKNCGLNIMALSTKRAQKTCTCSATWSCGACVYPTSLDPTCFHLPAPEVTCPRDTADGGSALIKPGITACTPPNSEVCGNVCGSATAGTFSYQDSTGTGKVGFCVCIAGAYQCASVAEWPAQQ